MKQLIIVGAGNFGRELYWHCEMSKGYETEFTIKGYIDDVYDPSQEKYKRLPAPWLGKIVDYQIEKDDVFICSICEGHGRETVTKLVEERGGEFINIINNTAIIQGNTTLGKGIILGPNVFIGDSVHVGNHVMMNGGSGLGHDTIVGDYTCIMGGVSVTGWCKVGERVYLADGCRMVPETTIEDDAYVGIGSVVIKRVKAGTRVFGNPARVMDF